MTVSLDGLKVAVLGGDARERLLIEALADCGAKVIVAGYRRPFEHPTITRAAAVLDAVRGADAVVAPMSHTDDEGTIRAVPDPSVTLRLDEAAFRAMTQGTPLFIGMAKPVIASLAQKYGIRLIQMAEEDEIAVLNSIPTGEGAIQRAMELLPITIHSSRALVVGFGRCGITLARMLHGLGAHTTVAARNPVQLARAEEMGLRTADLGELERLVPDQDVVFTTVPTLVLTRSVLERMRQECLVIDIASAPGGTDFEAAKELGIKALLELGLPGKVAPRTAGRILARVVPRLIAQICL